MLRTEPDPTPSPPSRWLKSTEWLAEHLRDRDVAVVDASYPTVTQKRDVLAEHRTGHIPGAVRLAKELGPGHTIVTILADYGTRYQSKLFNPDFLREKKLPVPAWLERKADIKIPYE